MNVSRGDRIAAAFLVSLILMVYCFAPAAASGTVPPTFSVESTEAAPGGTVSVNINVSGNPGILGATLKIAYDSELKLVEAKNGEAFGALAMTPPGKLASPCSFVWYAQSLQQADIKDGTVLSLTSEVSGDAQPGQKPEISVSYTPGDVFGLDLIPLACVMNSGRVTVADGSCICSLKAITTDDAVTVAIESAGAVERAQLCLAAYSAKGQLVDCSIRNTDITKGSNLFEFSKVQSASVYRAFLMKDCAPICEYTDALRGHIVTFMTRDGKVLERQAVVSGESAVAPSAPEVEGYLFSGWDGSLENITSDCTVTARYTEDTTPSITVESVRAQNGTATVGVRVRNNPGILGMTLVLHYDAQSLTLKSGANGEALSALRMTPPGRYRDGCSFNWYAESISGEDVQDGEILVLTFEVPSGTPAGTYPVTFTYAEGDVFDCSLQQTDINITGGGICVE